jgi:hypothetical protein
LLALKLGNHTASTFAEAKIILNGMGCGSDGRLNCMARMLLAAELNHAQGGSTCIVTNGAIGATTALLIQYGYHGFASYSLPVLTRHWHRSDTTS